MSYYIIRTHGEITSPWGCSVIRHFTKKIYAKNFINNEAKQLGPKDKLIIVKLLTSIQVTEVKFKEVKL